MPRYRVYLFRTDMFSIEVEAEDDEEAMEKGREAICDEEDPMQFLDSCSGFEADDAEELEPCK